MGPNPQVAILLLITVARVYCCRLKCQKKLKPKKQGVFATSVSLVTFRLGGLCPPSGYAYGELAMIARSWLFCYDMLGYCITKTCLFFFTLNTISCFTLSRDVEAEAVEAVKFLWKRKHFNERDRKRKRTRKRLMLFGAGSRSKKLQR